MLFIPRQEPFHAMVGVQQNRPQLLRLTRGASPISHRKHGVEGIRSRNPTKVPYALLNYVYITLMKWLTDR